ncbi:MAG: tetratricopeptide repeat protein, partial [Achromobacter sp.]|uniref:tetratricopeptide repeat protein n=1 Tax=Achromobacter sp. TaxID=134375 RepID=UPI003D06403D
MMSFPRSLVLSAALACAWAAAPVGAQAQARAEAPLEGAAWQFADEGYKNYDAGNYALAQQQAESAIVLRPDVERLRLLLIYALQKQGKLDEADKAAADAIASGLDSPALRQARANLRPAAATRPAASPAAPRASSAYQRGFPIATRAYADYNRADYSAAERGAERAFRIDPKQGAWAMLWLDALEAQGKYAEAEAAAAKAVSLGAPNSNDLAARQQTLKRRMAVKPAEEGYQALIANRPGDAVPLARQAVALAPESASHRLLLITALMLDNQLAAAEEAATDAMRQDDENTVALLMRGYLRQRQGRTQEADADFDAALKQDWLDDEQRRNVRLIAADAALAAGENARALALIEPLGGKDEAAAQRIKRAGARPAIPATLTLANYPAPVQDCRDTPYGTSCELLPSDAAGSGGPASLAYAAYAREDYQEAISQARKAAEQDPANKEYQRLLTTTLAAGNAAQLAEANTRMSAALAAQPDDPTLLMQRGYLHQRMRQPKLALEDFQAARATGKAPPTVILDEGYALAGVGDKRGAVDRLKEAIDENDAGKLDLTPQQRFDTRNAIGGLAREWGGYFSAGYRGARPASSGLGGAAITVPGDAVFSTAEIFWRPSDFLNSS